MTKRTTDEWEALLGRWVYDKQPDKLLGARERFAKVEEQEKAAPEAVAEVVRLHRTFREWATQLKGLSYEMDSKGYILNSEQIDAVTAGIHYILEGGNDD